mmetsp:Transcript_26256/g.66212  ORF Transcript_26256/g.66212 Transcript_26256/m.66212 type:complete len:287 (-) Transcript_26256:784-1644(-)|eukprot:CAMPEP_0178997858 /NCGR_PEP_ID=MMETSP0795-20121207/9191_1 /TAXON_ID=88552 /ORGANISM="Amoebophrya sp., Strain Ameob2" /LENGTH=286 /DNA_ID=CAMNT_0020690473 /DNA_START=455 /DNA_END=1315 /DNA_ORIENTATION=+
MATLYLLAHPQLLLHPDRLLDPDTEHRKKIDKWCAFLGNAEGRDKIGKIVQFFARFLDGFFREGPGAALAGEAAVPYCNQLRALWNGLQTARCWAWMGKSLIEWKTDIQTFESKAMDREVKYLHMAARFFFACRWFFENFMLLVKEKVLLPQAKGGFLPLPEAAVLNKYAKKFWLSAIVTSVVCECAKLRLLKMKYDAIEDLHATTTSSAAGKKQDPKAAEALEKRKEDLAKLQADTKLRLRTIVTNIADSPASISVGWGISMSNMTVGGLMTIASYLQCQNLFPK